MYNTPFNGGIPQAKIKAIDDGNYSDHLTFWTKTPGGPGNAVTEKVRITSFGYVGIGTPTPLAKLEVNGSLLVDGDINLYGTIYYGTSGIALFQAQGSSNNFSAGYDALASDTSNGGLGVNNTAVGSAALHLNTTGGGNTAVGTGTLSLNTTGYGNMAVGLGALGFNTTGYNNTANGYFSLYNNSAGYYNTATGVQSLFFNDTGTYNTASGFDALQTNNAGSGNTATGVQALQLSDGNYNTGLGYTAGAGLTTGSYSIMIGNRGLSGDDHTIRIGDVQTQTFIAGISGVNVSGVPVLVSSTGQLGIAQSSRHYKEDIRDMGADSQGLLRLRPVTFRYKQPLPDGSKPVQYGLIAEEVAEVYPDLVARSADGQIETVKYQVLDSMLLNEVQRQNEEIRSLKERLARLESLLSR